MDELNGLEIPESLADALRPRTLALIVYDMQVGVVRQIADGERVVGNVQRLLTADTLAAIEAALRTSVA